MKRIGICIFVFLLIIFFFLFISNSNKRNILINNYGISLKDNEYQNLLNLGFSNYEIMNMKLNEYESNKNLKGEILSQDTGYIQVSQHESTENKNRGLSMGSITSYGNKSGYVETSAKVLTTTIISVNGRYRYKVSLDWKNIPNVRSYDILGIGIDNNVKIVSDLYFQQNFCYSNNECNNSSTHTKKISSTGGAVSYELSHRPVVSMNSYLYFEVEKNTDSTITKLNAYGDYAHATKSINQNDTINYSINRSGILLEKSILNYYDTMTTAKAIWTGYW